MALRGLEMFEEATAAANRAVALFKELRDARREGEALDELADTLRAARHAAADVRSVREESADAYRRAGAAQKARTSSPSPTSSNAPHRTPPVIECHELADTDTDSPGTSETRRDTPRGPPDALPGSGTAPGKPTPPAERRPVPLPHRTRQPATRRGHVRRPRRAIRAARAPRYPCHQPPHQGSNVSEPSVKPDQQPADPDQHVEEQVEEFRFHFPGDSGPPPQSPCHGRDGPPPAPPRPARPGPRLDGRPALHPAAARLPGAVRGVRRRRAVRHHRHPRRPPRGRPGLRAPGHRRTLPRRAHRRVGAARRPRHRGHRALRPGVAADRPGGRTRADRGRLRGRAGGVQRAHLQRAVGVGGPRCGDDPGPADERAGRDRLNRLPGRGGWRPGNPAPLAGSAAAARLGPHRRRRRPHRADPLPRRRDHQRGPAGPARLPLVPDRQAQRRPGPLRPDRAVHDGQVPCGGGEDRRGHRPGHRAGRRRCRWSPRSAPAPGRP